MKLSRIGQALLPILLLFLMPVGAQEAGAHHSAPINVHPSSFSKLPVPISNFDSAPPDIVLIPHGEGAPNGHLWVRTGHDGLYIAGKVDGEQPDFPRAGGQLLSKAHVEVWLAGSREVDLPELGWGNQFEDESLPNGEESCAAWAKQQEAPVTGGDREKKCREWASAQARYRPYFKRLFLRQWLLSPDFGIESFATPAFDQIQKRFSGLGDEIPELMKPRGMPKMFLFPNQSGYSFEIFVPIQAFPPLPSLRPQQLSLMVDVFNAAPAGRKMGAYSSSSPTRAYGKAATFNLLQLEVPLYFSLTPCDLPLAGSDKRGTHHPAWFIPSGKPGVQYESETFLVVNDPAGYRYDPAGLSPTVRPIHSFWKIAGTGEWVCGPDLTYKKGDQSETFPYTISEDGFETKRLPEGDLLIKTGPRVWYSEFGSGQCGACPWTDVRIFDLAPTMKLYQTLALGDVISAPALLSQDFTVSPDWKQITEYNQEQSGSWASITWCLEANNLKDQPGSYVYKECGKRENGQPPDPPILKELRDREE